MTVLVNHPLVPPDSATSIYVPETPSTFFTIKISPVVTIYSAELRRMSLDMRNCLFPSERKSEYFRTYTYQSCLMECRMKHIIKKCNCYPYFFNISEVKPSST
ncbi:hypothetical protein C0J52_00512 [Blattella germanica]|nr:hypothetical protein C0J52_00512 [Blattella germanica]